MDARVFRPPCISPSFSLNLVFPIPSVRGVITIIQAGNIRKSVVWFYGQLRTILLAWNLEGLQPRIRFSGRSVGDAGTQGGSLAVDIAHLQFFLTPSTFSAPVAP